MSLDSEHQNGEHERIDNSMTPLLKDQTLDPDSSLFSKAAALLQDWWLWELLGSGTSILAMTAIVVILAIYDSSSLPDWPSSITINSTISLFSTIAKLSMLSSVGATISQSKWLWYRQTEPRRLQDLQTFDDASRGPWGAAHLLLSLRARHLALLGSVVTVLSLAFDPFLQQVVEYPSRLVSSGKNATIVRAQGYRASSDEGLPMPEILDLSMKANIYNGIFDIGDRAELGVDHTCATGDCTWQEFSTLAICSKCVNITYAIRKICDNPGCFEFSLPDGPSLRGPGGQINSTSGTSFSSTLKDISASVVKFSTLFSGRQADATDATAIECAMWYCIQEYTASVVDGVVNQNVLSSWRNDSAMPSQTSDLVYNPPHSALNDPADSSTFEVALLAARAMNVFLSTMFTGSGGVEHEVGFSSDVMQALYKAENITARIENLAISMSNNIRQQNINDSSLVLGATWKAETYVHVRWGWLALPIALVSFSLVFLIGAIIETSHRKVLVWKSSNLALLFHGLYPDFASRDSTPPNKLSQMKERAQEIKIALKQTPSEDWKLLEG